jgi:hypothetical protein
LTFRRVESKARMVYPVQPVGVSCCCCTAFRPLFELITGMPETLQSSCLSWVYVSFSSFSASFCSGQSLVRIPHVADAVIESQIVATENPCAQYRVGGIAPAPSSTYAPRMECSLNVPPIEQELAKQCWLLLLASAVCLKGARRPVGRPGQGFVQISPIISLEA